MNYYEPTPAQRESWAAGFHRVTLVSFGEPVNPEDSVTLTVAVTGRFNFVAFEREVFGIKPEDLTPCDLPAHDEILGSADIPLEAVVAMFRKERA